MAEVVTLLEPQRVHRNPENPRLIFRQEELQELQDSIATQGILVPLTVFQDKKDFFILDGERRWRCALKLGLTKVPVIIQPKPDRMQNIMMMFAIHNARRDWDPLPTALKLEELEKEYTTRYDRKPTESELAGIASLTRGEVRRLRMLLQLPQEYRQELLDELEKPRSKQQITVDHVLEATKGAASLRKQKVITDTEEEDLRRAIIHKFRTRVIRNTVAPRKLAKISQAVARKAVSPQIAKLAVRKVIKQSTYSIDDAYEETVKQADLEHTTEQLANRLLVRLEDLDTFGFQISATLKQSLRELAQRLAVLTQ